MEVTSKKQADWIHNSKIFQEGEKNSAKRTPLHLITWAHTSSFCTYFPKLNTTLLLAMSSHWLIFNHGHLNICCFNWAIALSLPSLPVVKLVELCRCSQPAATLHPQKLTGEARGHKRDLPTTESCYIWPYSKQANPIIQKWEFRKETKLRLHFGRGLSKVGEGLLFRNPWPWSYK